MLKQGLSIEEIRAAMPAVTAVAYLNTGTYGPLPAAAQEAMLARMQIDFERGRAGSNNVQDMYTWRSEVRRDAGRFLGAPAEETAITLSATYGMNYAIWGMNWREGDEIIVTNLEHIGGLATAYLLQERIGVVPRFVNCDDHNRVVDAIRAAITPRTKAIAYSHVAWGDGYVFPVADISALARARGVLTVVDAAQSAGAMEVDVKALGVDAYAAPGQKWLCGPGGTGALYVDSGVLNRIDGSFAGGATFEMFDEFGVFVQHPNARRFELNSGNLPVLLGFRAALAWQLEHVDQAWANARVVELADYARAELGAVDGVEVRTPAGTPSGLTNFAFAGWDPAAVVEELRDRGVVIRSISYPAGLRASTGYYNDRGDVDRLVSALREVRRLEPHPPTAPSGRG